MSSCIGKSHCQGVAKPFLISVQALNINLAASSLYLYELWTSLKSAEIAVRLK